MIPWQVLVPSAAIWLGSRSAAQGQRPPGPEDIVGIRRVVELALSPDGQRVAFVVSQPADQATRESSRRRSLWLVGTDGKSAPERLPGGSTADGSPAWSPDGRSLAFLSSRSDGPSGDQIYLETVPDGAVERLTAIEGGVERFRWSPDGSMIAFTARDPVSEADRTSRAERGNAIVIGRDQSFARLWILSIAARKSEALTRQDVDVKDFAWSPAGAEIALTVAAGPGPVESTHQSLVVVSRASGAIVRTLTRNVADVPNVLRWSPDGTRITFMENSPRLAFWVAVVPAQGGPTRGILKDFSGTLLQVDWLPDTRLLAQVITGTEQSLVSIDPTTDQMRPVAKLMQSQANYGFSTNGIVTAYLGQTPDSPDDVWVVRGSDPPRRLTDLNPEVRSWRLGRVERIEWKNTKDGLHLDGILLTPPGYQPGRRYPTIVENHPGDLPWWTGWHGSWWDWGQLLASHGYVVFLPNYRGVTGRGWRLRETLGAWGGMAFQDLMDGVDRLVAKGIADPTRLGIGGWSNGGFMTEWAITHTTRFRAAVAEAAHSDLTALYGTSPGTRPYLRANLGTSPYRQRATYDAHSPITFVAQCRTPTLLVHGQLDSGVPVGQSYEFHAALQDLGVETELIVYPRAGHVIQERSQQVDLQLRVLEWFDHHLRSQ